MREEERKNVQRRFLLAKVVLTLIIGSAASLILFASAQLSAYVKETIEADHNEVTHTRFSAWDTKYSSLYLTEANATVRLYGDAQWRVLLESESTFAVTLENGAIYSAIPDGDGYSLEFEADRTFAIDMTAGTTAAFMSITPQMFFATVDQ